MNITIKPTTLETISLMQCINVILRTYASNEDLVSVTGFSGNFNIPSIRTNYEREISTRIFLEQPDFYLIQENDAEKLKILVKTLVDVENHGFNPRGRYLVISKNFTGDFVASLASSYIINVVFLNPDTKKILTYFPYAEKNLNAVKTTLELLGRCEDVPKTDLYPSKVPNSWKNSTVRISFKHSDAYAMCDECREKGIDIDMMDIVLERTNIIGKYQKTKNISEIGISTNFEVFLGNYAPTYDRPSYGEFSMTYTEDAVVWLIPAPRQTPRWKYFLEIFEANVWIACFSTVCVIAITWGFARSIIHDLSFREFLTVPIATFHISLAQTFTFHFVLLSHRVLAASIIFLSIMMNFFFATRLTYLLNGRNMEADIESLDDAMDQKLVIGCHPILGPIFNNTKKRSDHLKDHFLQCDGSPKCLLRVAFERDMVMCRTMRRARFTKGLADVRTGKWLVKELHPPIYVKQNAVHFRKGLPMFELFNRQIFRLVESGFMKNIIGKYEKSYVVEDFSTPTRRLQLEHMVAPVFLWFLGVALAVSVFFVEKVSIVLLKFWESLNCASIGIE